MIFSYENGRVSQTGDGQSTCAVAIKKPRDTDNGKWTCQITTADAGNNIVSATSDIEVTISGKKLRNCEIFENASILIKCINS